MALLDLAEPEYPFLSAYRDTLPSFIPYAVRIRYDEELYPSLEETAQAFEYAEQFRVEVLKHLPAIEERS